MSSRRDCGNCAFGPAIRWVCPHCGICQTESRHGRPPPYWAKTMTRELAARSGCGACTGFGDCAAMQRAGVERG